MKTILCFGDSNVRGVIPELHSERRTLTKRYPKNKRWTGLLQKLLGEQYDIVEEGIGGCTTMFDEILPNNMPGRPYRNGLKNLPYILEAHYPVDLVILLLGLNDTKIQLNVSSEKIAEGMLNLAKLINISDKGENSVAPKILIIGPFPILPVADLPEAFDNNSIEKSKRLPKLYENIAKNEGFEFLDISKIVRASKNDGLHLDEDQHVLLANSVAKKIIGIFN